MDSQEIESTPVMSSQPTNYKGVPEMKNRLHHDDDEGYQVTDRWRLYLRLSLLSMACQKVCLQDNSIMKTRRFMLGLKWKAWATIVGFKGR